MFQCIIVPMIFVAFFPPAWPVFKPGVHVAFDCYVSLVTLTLEHFLSHF